jgi:hypothetical protein
VVVGLDLHGHDRIVLKVEKPAGWIAAAVGGHHEVVVCVALVDQRRGPLGIRVASGGGEQQYRGVVPVVAFLAVGFVVSVDVLLTEHWGTHQSIFCASSTMICAGPRT